MAIESRRRQSPRLKEEKLLGAAKQTIVRGATCLRTHGFFRFSTSPEPHIFSRPSDTAPQKK